jgi:hypothetical protein
MDKTVKIMMKALPDKMIHAQCITIVSVLGDIIHILKYVKVMEVKNLNE